MDRGLHLPGNDTEETLPKDPINRYRRDILPSKRGKSLEPDPRMPEPQASREIGKTNESGPMPPKKPHSPPDLTGYVVAPRLGAVGRTKQQ
jgi:hypothetical protein